LFYAAFRYAHGEVGEALRPLEERWPEVPSRERSLFRKSIERAMPELIILVNAICDTAAWTPRTGKGPGDA